VKVGEDDGVVQLHLELVENMVCYHSLEYEISSIYTLYVSTNQIFVYATVGLNHYVLQHAVTALVNPI